MTANRAAFLQELRGEFGVDMQIPKGSNNETVKLKGPVDAMDKVDLRIAEFMAEVDAQVTIECIIDPKYQRTVIGAGGANLRKIVDEFKVKIDFPDRSDRPNNSKSGKKTEKDIKGGNEFKECTCVYIHIYISFKSPLSICLNIYIYIFVFNCHCYSV